MCVLKCLGICKFIWVSVLDVSAYGWKLDVSVCGWCVHAYVCLRAYEFLKLCG